MRCFVTVCFLVCSAWMVDAGVPWRKARNERTKRQTDSNEGYNVVCYFPNWSQYRRSPATFTVRDIDPHLCTHVIFAFAKITNDDNLGTYEWNDQDTYEAFNDVRRQNPGLKTLLSVGGATMGSGPFDRVSSSSSNRRTFTRNVISYLRQHAFDGLDVDWEFPLGHQRDQFTALLQELRAGFQDDATSTGRSRLLLTAALGAAQSTIEQVYNLPAIANALDFANVMTYNLHGAWDGVLGMHSGLYGSYPGDPLTQSWVVQRYMSLGLPAEQIVLGIPTYGRSFALCSSTDTDVRDRSCGTGQPGTYTQTAGFLAYHEICPRLGSDWTAIFSEQHKTPYAMSEPPVAGGQWVAYDDPRSVIVKAEYVRSQSLVGAMFWDLSMDDFSNQCGDGEFPLINAAKSALNNNVSSSSTAPSSAATATPTTTRTTATTRGTGTTVNRTTTSRAHSTSFTTARSTTITATTASPSSGPGTVTCPSPFATFRDPHDCGAFYHCSWGHPYRKRCPAGLYFDNSLGVCNWPWAVPCN